MKERLKNTCKIVLILLLTAGFSPFVDAQKKNESFVLVLDAGHGGHDSGAIGVKENEKDVALAITLKLGKLIQDYYKNDVKVIYTRKDDTFVNLSERADIANRNHADFFISIHCNSAHPRAQGTETFVLGSDPKRADSNFSIVKKENSVILLEENHQENYEGFDPKSPESLIGLTLMQNTHLENSLKFAYNVENNFVNKDNRLSRGVKQAGFVVLWRTATPSVLVETGFVTHPEEGAYLASEKGKDATAESIFNAFKIYKKDWDTMRGYTNNYEPQKGKKTQPKPVEVEKPIEGKVFKVQFLSSRNQYRENSPQLKGLKNVEIIKEDGFYKYYYGKTSFASKRDSNLKYVKQKGFPDAFIVEESLQEEKAETPKVTNKEDFTGFKIQILTSQRNYASNSPQLKGLKPVEIIKDNRLYYYYYGQYSAKEEAVKDLGKVKSKGFADAFIIEFKDGEKI